MPSRVNPIWEPLVPNDRMSRHVRSRTCIASATAPTSGFWNGPLGWLRVWAVWCASRRRRRRRGAGTLETGVVVVLGIAVCALTASRVYSRREN